MRASFEINAVASRPSSLWRLISESNSLPVNDDVYYQCQRCTNCCRWPGFVKITDDDIAALSRFLGVSDFDFIQSYTRLRQYRDGLALIEKPNGECIFLDGRDCSVQAVKPKQCKGFPNEWNFPGRRAVCEAVPVPRA